MSNRFNESYVGLRKDLIKHIKGVNLDILDLGCSTGVNGRYLLDKKIASSVVGIEYDQEMAVVANQSYERVIVGDLDDGIYNKLGNRLFNVILLGDILEHTQNPEKILKDLVSFVKKKGMIIISLPNIGHIDTYIHLAVKKTWPKNNRGIWDATHKSFFTKNDMIRLVNNANLKIESSHRNFRYRDAIKKAKFPIHGALLKFFFPDLYTFQYILVCSKK